MKQDEKKEKSTDTSKSLFEKVSEYNKKISEYEGAQWDRLPDIELYMDQVVTFIDRQLEIYKLGDDEKLVTPSMINNYTKARLVPRAESKKYSKEHIALIMSVFSLKKVLSMPDISKLLHGLELHKDDGIEKFYEKFIIYQSESIKKITDEVEFAIKENNSNKDFQNELLKNLALELSVRAQISCVIAEHIINIIGETETFEK